ncbi:MAG: hypothetical protein ACREJ2_02205 [Planctomycetota bacterium]
MKRNSIHPVGFKTLECGSKLPAKSGRMQQRLQIVPAASAIQALCLNMRADWTATPAQGDIP